MSPRRTLGTLLVLGVGLLSGLTSVSPAAAVTGSPPVAAPDAASLYPGNDASVQPVANDSDPDNDELTICRLGPERYSGLEANFFGNDFDVFARARVKPGTYTFTYYVCDFSYLTAGTITITVKQFPKIKVKKIDGRPGRLRVTNPADFAIRLLYGRFGEDGPDGLVVVRRHSSVRISVHRTRIDWIAYDRRGLVYLGTGHVRHIKLPGDDRPVASSDRLAPRLAEAWRVA